MDLELQNQLLQMIREAAGKLKWRDDMITRHRALYELRHYSPDSSSGLSQSQKRLVNQYSYQSNTPTNVVDLTVGILSHNQPKYRAFTYTENRDSNLQAGELERLCAGLLAMNSIEQEADLHHDVVHAASIDGGVAVRCVWVPVEDEEPPQQNSLSKFDQLVNTGRRALGKPEVVAESKPGYIKGNPLKIHVIPLKNMVYVPGGPLGRWALVAYRCKRTVADIKTEFPNEFPQITTLSQQFMIQADFFDVWFWNGDEVWNAIFVDNRMVRCGPMEGYYDLPYTIAFFRPHDSEEISNWGYGTIFTIEDDTRILEDRISHQLRMLDIWSNLPMVVKTRDGRAVDVDAVFGKTVNLGLEESAGFIQPGSEPPDHDKILTLIRQSMSEGSFPPVTYGAGPGMSSGYGLSQLSEGGRIRLEQPKRQIELLWTVVLRKALALFRAFAPEKGIQVYGEYKGEPFALNSLTGSSTSGWLVTVELDPHFPQDEARMMALGNQALAMKGLSRRTVQERFYGVDDPDRENQRILIEMLMQNPQMMDTMLREAAKEYGMEYPEAAPPGPGGSPPRQPISQPLMSNPEQGVAPLPLAGSPQTGGDEERLAAALGGM